MLFRCCAAFSNTHSHPTTHAGTVYLAAKGAMLAAAAVADAAAPAVSRLLVKGA